VRTTREWRRKQPAPAASQSGVDLAAMDKTADPCTDFYQYACGGWIAQHPAPPDQPRYGRFEDLQERNNAILEDILENAAANTTTPDADIRKIGDYYASCMDEQKIDTNGLAPLRSDLDRVDAIASLPQLPAVVGHLQTTGVATFFGFGAAPDFKDASHYMLIFGQGGLGLPDRDYYLKDDPATAQIRDQYVRHVSKMLQLSGLPPARAQAAGASVLKIETMLARSALDRVSRRNPTNIYHKLPMSEVRALVPSFNMSAYLETADAPRADAANVTEPAYMNGVEQVLSTTPLADLKLYMRWQVLHGNAPVLPTPFVDEQFAFYGRTLTGAKAQRPRWKRCVDAVDSDLGEALGKV
jgi:endothelin-converting enzyme/putative endopeptidase